MDSEQAGVGAAGLALRHLTLRRLRRHTAMVDAEAQFARCAERHQQLACADQLAATVRTLFANGWTPLDLHTAARRKVDPAIAEHLMCVVAQQTAGRGAVHPELAAQVSVLSTTVDGGSLPGRAEPG